MKPMTKMVWHIFTKDARLLWPFVLGAAGIQFALAGLRYMLDRPTVRDVETLNDLYQLLGPASILAAAFLIAMAVHQDAIPGVRQDWLVRPVRRRDLLVTKLVFVLVMVHGPIFVADTIQALVNGFPVGQSLASAATRGLFLLASLSLPVLAFASLTRNMTDAVIGGVLIFLTIFVSGELIYQSPSHRPATAGTGLGWMALLSMIAVLLLGAIVIFTIQYFRRKTNLSRWLTVAIFCLGLVARFIPWHLAFALEERLSPSPGAGSPIVAAYEPKLGEFRLPKEIVPNMVVGRAAARDETSTVYVPLHMIGLPDDGVLLGDRSQVRLLAADGKVVHAGSGDDLRIRKEGHQGPVHFIIGSGNSGFVREISTSDLSVPQNGEAWIYQGISFPRGIYERIKNRPLRLEIKYSLTLLEGSSYTMPALGGDQVLPGLGQCSTRMDDEGDDIQVHCMQAGLAPSCTSAFLEHVPSGQRNPAFFNCRPLYAPFLPQIAPDGISRFGGEIRFHDLSGLVKYPVDATQVPASLVVIRVYEAKDHFTRQLVIPEIRLVDWHSIESTEVAESRSGGL